MRSTAARGMGWQARRGVACLLFAVRVSVWRDKAGESSLDWGLLNCTWVNYARQARLGPDRTHFTSAGTSSLGRHGLSRGRVVCRVEVRRGAVWQAVLGRASKGKTRPILTSLGWVRQACRRLYRNRRDPYGWARQARRGVSQNVPGRAILGWAGGERLGRTLLCSLRLGRQR